MNPARWPWSSSSSAPSSSKSKPTGGAQQQQQQTPSASSLSGSATTVTTSGASSTNKSSTLSSVYQDHPTAGQLTNSNGSNISHSTADHYASLGFGTASVESSDSLGLWAPRKLSVVPQSPSMADEDKSFSRSSSPQLSFTQAAHAAGIVAPSGPTSSTMQGGPTMTATTTTSVPEASLLLRRPVLPRRVFSSGSSSGSDDFGPGSGFGGGRVRDVPIDGLPQSESIFEEDRGETSLLAQLRETVAAAANNSAQRKGSVSAGGSRPTLTLNTRGRTATPVHPPEASSFVNAAPSNTSIASRASSDALSHLSASTSRNDIFSAPSPIILPAPRMGPAPSPRVQTSSGSWQSPPPSVPSLPSLPSPPKYADQHASSASSSSFEGSSSNSSFRPMRMPAGSSDSQFQAGTSLLTSSSSISVIPDGMISPPSQRSNKGFFDSVNSVHPTPVLPPNRREPSSSSTGAASGVGGSTSMHTRKPSTGRRTTEEREIERARIRRRNEESVEFRLRVSKECFLAEGRHCNVYLGAYRRRRPMNPKMSGSGDDKSGTLGSYHPQQQQPSPITPVSASSSSMSGTDAGASSSISSHPLGEVKSDFGWKLCAIKRLHADKTSQLVGLDEAFALRRLGAHPNVVKLIDIRDEVEIGASAGATLDEAATRMQEHGKLNKKTSRTLLGKGLPTASAANLQPGDVDLQAIAHGRSASDIPPPSATLPPAASMHGREVSSPDPPAAPAASVLLEPEERGSNATTATTTSTHRRLVSQPLEVNVDSAEGLPQVELPSWNSHPNGLAEENGMLSEAAPTTSSGAADSISKASAAATSAAARSCAHDAPRLLILLELLPHSLYSYARKYPERVDLQQWLTWAVQLADVLAWMHERGAVHADVKKENILLTEDLTLKLCDFNSTLWIDPNSPPTDGAGLGTPAYGAPELTRAISGGTAFDYAVDVWSMGAVLYSLAAGVEPFSRANSMVDLMYRKRIFFQSEEEERLRRLNVSEGMSGDNQSASRKGSLRGRKSGPRSSIMSHKRDSSVDSIDSVASNITNMSGRAPTAMTIARLLGDDQDFHALESPQDFGSSNPGSPLGRAASIHNGILQQQQQSRGTLGPPSMTPSQIRRTASFQGAQDASREDAHIERSDAQDDSGPPTRQYGTQANRKRSSGSVSSVGSLGGTTSQLYVAVSQALEKAKRQNEQEAQAAMERQPDLTDAEQIELNRPYADGMPPIILPGGGRLPDAARDLLARMLRTDPKQRPTARQVKDALLKIQI